jgi:hypothetical protein
LYICQTDLIKTFETQDACKNKITNVNDRRYANKENEEIIVRGSERNKNKTN